jgi:hypothetical protein
VYTCISVAELASAITLYDDGEISLTALRLYLATQEAKAIREATKRTLAKRRQQSGESRGSRSRSSLKPLPERQRRRKERLGNLSVQSSQQSPNQRFSSGS